jgi:hypothetical protein
MPMDPDVYGTTAWRKSCHSVNNGACVEAAADSAGIVVRDSANRAGPVLRYSAQTWHVFVAQVKVGKFDVAAG